LNKYFGILLIVMFVCSMSFFTGCDGLFPTAPKPTVPGDHNNNIKDALHKGTGDELKPDECDDCHSIDIRGKVSLINGVYTWAPSCYQCHGALWDRFGNGNGNYDSKHKLTK
jgi:hypothetical protein